MNNSVELRIGHIPWRYAAGLVEIPGVALRQGLPWRMTAAGRHWPIRHVRPDEGPREPRPFAEYARAGAGDQLPLVLGPYIRRDIRDALEQVGVSYFDFFGNVHLVAPGILVHVSTPLRLGRARALGVVGIRGAQVMLERHERAWGVTDLAREASISVGQSQNVMQVLEASDLVIAEGRGPRKRRRIREPGRYLDWLSAQEPGRRPRSELTCALYARTPEALWDTLASRFRDIPYAISGAAGASILGVSATTLTRTVIRLRAGTPLRVAASIAQAELTDRGANLVLWPDVGNLGTHGSEVHAGRVVAPRARIYIDLLSEMRGEDLAGDFRDRVLGY